jgi:hypothetical protein
MKFQRCDCNPHFLRQLRRAWWMRLFLPLRRLYVCPHCGKRMLIKPDQRPD